MSVTDIALECWFAWCSVRFNQNTQTKGKQ